MNTTISLTYEMCFMLFLSSLTHSHLLSPDNRTFLHLPVLNSPVRCVEFTHLSEFCFLL